MSNIIRIKKNSQFQRLYKKGKNFSAPAFALYIRRRGDNKLLLGVTVSKKIGNAVLRNRAKRVLRAAMRDMEKLGLSGYEVILCARSKTPFVKSTYISKGLCELLLKNGYLKS